MDPASLHEARLRGVTAALCFVLLLLLRETSVYVKAVYSAPEVDFLMETNALRRTRAVDILYASRRSSSPTRHSAFFAEDPAFLQLSYTDGSGIAMNNTDQRHYVSKEGGSFVFLKQNGGTGAGCADSGEVVHESDFLGRSVAELVRRWAAQSRHGGGGGVTSARIAVAFTNAAYIEEGLLPNLICSFKRLKLRWYVIIPTDVDAAKSLLSMEPEFSHHTLWEPDFWNGTSSGRLRETYNATQEYLFFIRKRTAFTAKMVTLLQKHNSQQKIRGGFCISELYVTDGDTVWMQDPSEAIEATWRYLAALHSQKFGAPRCDGYVVNDANVGVGTMQTVRVEPVGGFIVWKVNKRVAGLYARWVALMGCLGSREQPALHAALSETDALIAKPLSWPALPHLAAPDQLTLCVLPAFHFPTSQHLSMRATDAGLKSPYMSQYGLKDPKDVRDTLAVAHANIKYKTDDNKVRWLKQFHLMHYDVGAKVCQKGDVPRPLRAPVLGGKGAVLETLERGVAHVSRGVGWSQEGTEWVHSMSTYLLQRKTPTSLWEKCAKETLW